MSKDTVKQKINSRVDALAALVAVIAFFAMPARSAEAPAKSDAALADRAFGMVLHDPMDGPVESPPSSRALVQPKTDAGRMEFVPGRWGRCAHFVTGGHASIKYPMSVLPFDEGTIEFYLAFDKAPSILQKPLSVLLFHAGKARFANSLELFHGGAEGWSRKLYFMVCDGKAVRSSIAPTTTEWKAGEWRHVALTWKLNAAGECTMAVYIDRQIVEQRTGLTILQDKDAMAAAATDPKRGFLWIAPSPLGDSGFKIDELRIYNVRRQYSQAE